MKIEKKVDNDIVVYVLYKTLLNRDPNPEELASHVIRLYNGEATLHQLGLDFMRSAEFSIKQHRAGWELITASDQRLYTGYDLKDLAIFDEFSHASPQPQRGFLTEFIGSRARISSLWNECRAFDGMVLPLPIPYDYHADAVEWIGMLKAVLAAKETFTAMELGSGHGPWIAASAAAAQLRGIRELNLCAVEADPERFAFLRQNIVDNGLADQNIKLVQAAVGVTDGIARWPRISDPRNTAGARPLRDGNREDEAYLRNMAQDMIEVEVVSASRLLMSQPLWDFVHIDIQGTEAELCAGCLSTLSERVRYLVVGTHSRKLDGEVMDILFAGGWLLEHEKPARMICSSALSLINLTTGDGTQVWRNPRL